MKRLLAVIDMQKDFIDGALGTKEAAAIVPMVKARIKAEADSGSDIVFTRDTHHGDYLDTQEGRKLPVPHCIEGTEGWQISDELSELVSGRKIFDKPTFGSLELMDYVREQDYQEVVLLGLCTDICVISNAMLIKAAMPETVVKVVSDCCAGVTVDSHNNALSAMKMCQIEVE
jgi:nicotinamidase-related amidase